MREAPDRRFLPRVERSPAGIPADLRAVLRGLCKGQSPWPLYLYGPPGTGKTCAGLCLTDYANTRAFYVLSALRDRVASARARRLHDEGSGYSVSEKDVWAELERVALAVIDEVAVRAKDDTEYEVLKRVAELREGRPVVFIGNVGPDTLTELYDARITSRVCCGTVIDLAGPDRRLTGGDLAGGKTK